METYTDINFSFKDEKNLDQIKKDFDVVKKQYDIEYEEIGRNGDQICIHFTAGSEGEDIALAFMAFLQERKCKFARSFTFGDEEPAYKLYSLVDGEVYEFDCDPALFEYLEDADEDELDEFHLAAKEEGPEKHFSGIYSDWHEGIKKIEGQQDYKELIDQAISCCS